MERKITPALEAHVVAHAGAGKSSRWIADWLGRRHSISISHVQVAALIKQTSRATADSAKVSVRSAIQSTLPRHLRVLDGRIRWVEGELKRIEARLKEPLDSRERSKLLMMWHRLTEALRRLVDTLLHYSGADQPDDTIDGLADLLIKAAAE